MSRKNIRYNWLWRMLHADRRKKQNHKEENVRTLHLEPFRWTRGIGLILNQGNILSLRTKFLKKVILLRHSQQVHREEDGAIQFWRRKFHLRNHSSQVQHWSDEGWKCCLAARGGSKGDSSTALMIQEQFFISELFKDIQDTILLILYCRTMLQIRTDSSKIFTTLDVRSIFIQSWTMDWYLEVRIQARETKSILSAFFILETKVTRILRRLIWMNHFMHNTCMKHGKRHQDAVYWVDINLAIWKGLTFYQTRSNYFKPKVVRLKTGEVFDEKVYMSRRPPPKISLRHEWTRELGSKVCQQPEGETVRQPGEVVRQTKFFKSTQPTPNPIRDRSGDLITWKMEETRPVLKRSILILWTKNSVLQTERGDLLKQR